MDRSVDPRDTKGKKMEPMNQVNRRQFLLRTSRTAAAGLLASAGGLPAPTEGFGAVDRHVGTNTMRYPLGGTLHTLGVMQPLLRVGFGSCYDVKKNSSVWSGIQRLKPDVWISLGDNVYTSDFDMEELERSYRRLLQTPDFRDFRKSVSFLATWDDHDYGLNNGGADFRFKNRSRDLFYEFIGVSHNAPVRKQGGVYHASTKVFGSFTARILLLDLRSGLRKPAAGSGLPGQMMDAEQWRWLEHQLRLPADLVLIGSSIQVLAEEHRFEKWANIPSERERLFELVTSATSSPVVFLSGDRHFHEFSALPLSDGRWLTEVTSSGLNKGVAPDRLPEETNRYRVLRAGGSGFGVIDLGVDALGKLRAEALLLDTEGALMVSRPLELR